jgi:hypothetical protein
VATARAPWTAYPLPRAARPDEPAALSFSFSPASRSLPRSSRADIAECRRLGVRDPLPLPLPLPLFPRAQALPPPRARALTLPPHPLKPYPLLPAPPSVYPPSPFPHSPSPSRSQSRSPPPPPPSRFSPARQQ